MLEKRDYLNELYDLYGPMLTDKQKKCFVLYYQEDFSLAEIGEIEDISRNGVYDNLKRGENLLLSMEEKLKIHSKMFNLKNNLDQIQELLNKTKEQI